MTSKLGIAVCQMTSIDDVDSNLQQIKNFIHQISQQKLKSFPVQIAFFPENCLYMRVKEGEKISGLKVTDPVFTELQKIAMENNLGLHLGSVPLLHHGSLANMSVMISPDGNVMPSYQKIHLFDIALEGFKPIRESDVFQHGQKPQILDFQDWSLGQSICYDLRFSELYSHYAKKSVDLILIPSAFLPKTGEAHWEILIRARAIESQAFVVAAAQVGRHQGVSGGERMTYGKSLVVGPWGNILAQGSSEHRDLLLLQLDRSELLRVRSQIPMQSHRRI